jgi:hypothetical protein
MIRFNKRAMCAASALALLLAAAPAQAETTGDVRDLIADLYGGAGLTLDPTVIGHVAHFSAASSAALNNLSSIISSNVSTYAFNSTVAAVSFDLEQGVPVRTQESLGPILAERARTIGRNRLNLGASYAYIDYKQLNGRAVSDLTLDLAHEDVPGDIPYEHDIIRLNLDLKLRQQRMAFFATYGLTDSLDVALIVPVVETRGSVKSTATIIPFQPGTPHQFGGSTMATASNKASATGLGDISLRAKWHATQGLDTPVEAAVVAQATFATGDEKDLLGTGSHSAFLGGVLSAELGRFNPHFNVGYEQFFDDDSAAFKRSNVRAVTGFDVAATPNLAFSAEVLARWLTKGPDFYDFAIGGKWEAFKGVPLTANIVLPINRNKGLRPDYVLMFGIESTF